MTTAYLIDHPNPNGKHYYESRRAEVTLGVLHTAEIVPRLLEEGEDDAAERLCRWLSATTRQVSWHDTGDSDSEIFTLPYDYTGWHVRGYNSRSVGMEMATRAALWTTLPESRVEGFLEQAVIVAARWVEAFDLPIRLIGRAEADAGLKGFISHAVLDPTRRTDPGPNFPWDSFLRMLAEYLAEPVTPAPTPTPAPEPDERYKVPGLLMFSDYGEEVLLWQRNLLRWSENALPIYGADGGFGGETHEWTREFQKYAAITDDGIVGPVTLGRMKDALSGRLGVTPGTFDLYEYPGVFLAATTYRLHSATWQKALNAWRAGCVKIDNVYGPVTERWTKLFQTEYSLYPDGVVGPVTWNKMREVLN